MIGQRPFCDEHYLAATHERASTWRSLVIQVVALVLFVAVVYAGAALIRPVFTATTLLATGILLAIIPGVIWLAFFYQQDRLEPEPKGFLLAVFALGALLAAAVGVPLVNGLFRVSNWVFTDSLTTLLGSILVVGFAQEFLKYAAVRYSVYTSPEFDEPTDGVIYATAAGLGYATVLNIQFVVDSGGVALGAGVIRVVVTALAHASFAGITGYFLGRAKFWSEPLWWMPLGLTLAAVSNGVFNWLRGQLVQGGMSLQGAQANPWLGLALAALVAIGVTGAITWLVRRNIRAALKAGGGAQA
jgi:RsiW-degrading membrane proteinase PrsW (M82 family)